MKFSVDRERLLKALAMVLKAIPSKIELPILQNVKISMNEKGLELTTSDNTMSIKTTIPFMDGDKELIKNSKPGETLLECKSFFNLIKDYDCEFIDCELIDNSVLKISYDNMTDKPNTIRADEYPEIDFNHSGATFDIKTSVLTKIVDQTAFAASTKESKIELTAVNVAVNDGVLTATATDSHRFARKRVDVDCSSSFSVNIPAKKFIEIVHSFEGEEFVTVTINEKKATFSFGATTISTRLIGNKYPNTKNVIPASQNFFLEVDSREFLRAINHISTYNGSVKMIMTEDEVILLTPNSSRGSGDFKLKTFQFSGERLEICFDPNSVSDAIRALGSDDVTIAFTGEMKPFVIKNVKDDSVDMLLTPLRP